jgi:molybdopterin-guanine dinucleotide biosynthesis protein A
MTSPPIDHADITGLVLAGGRATRMGGRDKGLLELAGEPLAARALRRLRPQVGALLLNANRNLDAYATLGVPLCADPPAHAFAGPLAGIEAGLDACRTAWLLAAPCDCPLLPADLAARLADAVGAAPAAIARAGGRRQPVFCLLRREQLAALREFLDRGGTKVDAFTASIGAVEVDFDDAAAFLNVNDADELDRVARQLENPP